MRVLRLGGTVQGLKLKKGWRDSVGEEMNISRNNTKPETEVSWSVWRKKEEKSLLHECTPEKGAKEKGGQLQNYLPSLRSSISSPFPTNNKTGSVTLEVRINKARIMMKEYIPGEKGDHEKGGTIKG